MINKKSYLLLSILVALMGLSVINVVMARRINPVQTVHPYTFIKHRGFLSSGGVLENIKYDDTKYMVLKDDAWDVLKLSVYFSDYGERDPVNYVKLVLSWDPYKSGYVLAVDVYYFETSAKTTYLIGDTGGSLKTFYIRTLSYRAVSRVYIHKDWVPMATLILDQVIVRYNTEGGY